MTKVKRCSQCGKEVSQGGSFCPFCGNIINETVKSESRESAIDGLDNDIQKKYQNDINKKLQKQMYLIYIYPDKCLINKQLYECSKLQIQNFLLHNSTALQEEKQKRIHTTDYSILHKYYGNYLFPT